MARVFALAIIFAISCIYAEGIEEQIPQQDRPQANPPREGAAFEYPIRLQAGKTYEISDPRVEINKQYSNKRVLIKVSNSLNNVVVKQVENVNNLPPAIIIQPQYAFDQDNNDNSAIGPVTCVSKNNFPIQGRRGTTPPMDGLINIAADGPE